MRLFVNKRVFFNCLVWEYWFVINCIGIREITLFNIIYSTNVRILKRNQLTLETDSFTKSVSFLKSEINVLEFFGLTTGDS